MTPRFGSVMPPDRGNVLSVTTDKLIYLYLQSRWLLLVSIALNPANNNNNNGFSLKDVNNNNSSNNNGNNLKDFVFNNYLFININRLIQSTTSTSNQSTNEIQL
jgi:hypothetical protein